jgi:tRNA(fMet)-specific endonuclease VapC
MSRYLLDTNMLLGFVRRAPWATRIREEHGLADPETIVFTSVVCKGEMFALAEKFGWGRNRRTQLQQVLSSVPTLYLDDQVVSAYALIDAWTHGTEVDSPNNVPPPQPAIPMSQNDLWIAATAHAMGTVLISTDGDFDHLKEDWLQFIYVDQA